MVWVSLGLHVPREDNTLECVAVHWAINTRAVKETGLS